jgi:hypothetical protein
MGRWHDYAWCWANPHQQRFLIHPSYTRKECLVVFNDILVSRKENKLASIKEGDFLY